VQREKTSLIKRKNHRNNSRFLNSNSKCKKVIKRCKKESSCQPRLVYPAKLSFLIKGEIKTFHNKKKVNEFVTTKPILQKILKEFYIPKIKLE
jgi:hypothetical protein